MGDNGKVTLLSTIKKDEAGFYLSELARCLLKNRVRLRIGERTLVMTSFDCIQMEMSGLDKDERYALDIHLSWRKPPPDSTVDGPKGDSIRPRMQDRDP